VKKRIFLLSLILLTSCARISEETIKRPIYRTLDILPIKDHIKQEMKQIIDEEVAIAWYYVKFWVDGIRNNLLK
jgi:hypothetical protein